MNKAKLSKIILSIITLIALSSLTTSVWADTYSMFLPMITNSQMAASSILYKKPDIEYIIENPCDGFDALEGVQIYCGVHKGAAYRIEVPDNWNGDLLMWAHGYRLFYSEFLWVDNPPFREWLIENGYAWAASSYSANGVNITVGVKDTKTLVEFFKEEIASPEHVYISGESMGGGISVSSIEQWPDIYAGGMPTCGLIAPYKEFDYLWDFYVLSNALAEHDATFPIPEDFVTSGDYATVVNTLAGAPGYFPYLLNPEGEQLKNAVKMITGGVRPLYDQGFNLWYGLIDELWGFPVMQIMIDFELTGVNGVWVDNWDTIYQFDMDPEITPEEEALNEIIFRIQRDPQAMHPNGLKNIPITTGKIKVPVLTLHGIGDLFVPFSQEQIYAQRVAEKDASDFLVQRAIREIVHCEFTQEEYTTAFSDLVSWVETGSKPTGDDILDPAVVSDDYFGCQFTSEDRDYSDFAFFGLEIPPCP